MAAGVTSRQTPRLPAEEAKRLLARAWGPSRRPLPWLRTVSSLDIGKRYLVTAFGFFAAAGVLGLMMRWQLVRPENDLMGPDLFDQVFTMHGTTMMFLFAVPVMDGLAIYLVPLMLGTRNLPFPRLNAFGYYVYLLAGLLLWGAFLLGIGPDAGWFSYVPLSGPEFSPGKRVDVWAQLITMTEIAALIVAVQIVVAVLKLRAVGMSLDRIPLYVWSMLVTSFMVIFAMPSVALASTVLALDRLVGTHLFNQVEGSDPLLWQHLFWFFGHPEVYIIFVPALGIISSIVATFSRRPVFGYPAMVLALLATGFVSFGLWVHHMFTTGLPQLGESFFTSASMLIAVPTGVQIFCWIATLATGRPQLRSPLLFVLGFFAIFVVGGLSGVMLGSVPLDLQVHDTYFVVAHFHYVLIGGAVFPLLGGIYYWLPKLTGRMPNERLAKWSFWVLFAGFNLTFFPMHLMGLDGMPRRVYTYLPERGWQGLNELAAAGGAVLGLGVLLFVGNVLWTARRGAPAGDDPWGADTLEWSTGSPPPPWSFGELPVVVGRRGRWEPNAGTTFVTGLESDKPEVLVTNVLDAQPELRAVLPRPSIFPFLTALAVCGTFLGAIFTPWAVVWGSLPIFLTLLGWVNHGDEAAGGGAEDTAPATAVAPEAAT